MTPRARGSWWWRLIIAAIAAYLVGYLVATATGNADLRKVGWGENLAPALAEGAVFGFVVRGVWGAVLAPLPLLLAPETWIRLVTIIDVVGLSGVLVLTPLVPAMWAAGAVGAIVRRLFPWLVL